MSDSIANGYGCRPCKQVQLNVTDAIIHFIGDGSALSHLNASNVDFGTLSTSVFPASGVTVGTYGSSANVAQVTIDTYGRVTSATNVAITSSQWTGTPGSPIYYIPGVGIGSSSPATANLQVTGNVYVSNSITTTNVITNNLFSLTGNVNVYGNIVSTGNIYATEYHGDGGLLSNISIAQPFANLVVSNSVTTTNVFATRYYGDGGLLSNISSDAITQPFANLVVSNSVTTTNVFATRYYGDGGLLSNISSDTITQPFANLAVSNSVTTTNIFAMSANIATMNVGYLTVDSAVVYGTSTLNVYGTSNLTNVTVTDTFNVNGSMTANAANATFFFDTFTIPYINTQELDVSSVLNFTGPLATFSNLYVPGNANIEYLSVSNLSVTGNLYVTATNLQTTNALTINNSGTMTALKVTQNETSIHTHNVAEFWDATTLAMVIDPEGNVAIHTASSPGYALTVTDPANFETLYIRGKNDTTTLDVTGNIYASNAVTTANIFAETEVLTGTTGQTTLNVTGNIYASNAVTTGNIFVSNGLGVGPATLGTNVVVFSNISGGANTFVMDSNGRVSIGAATQRGGSLLSFGQQSANKVVTLFDGNSADNPVLATNFYGFGRNTDTLRYQVNDTGGRHTFFGGSTEYARITGTGVSILTGANPTSTLQVTGNAYISNSLTTTNVFANTLTMSNATSTINVTGNIYASNAVTTTNLFTAGITSNVTSTIFNSDTLTIPFVYSTTLNVASTSNLDVVTITGEPGLTSLNVTGNIYASNAVTTTNVFATTLSTTNPIPFRNRIINGGMNVWQRNTAAISTTSGIYTTADRWCGALGTSGLILSQWPGPTEAPQFPYSLQVTTSTTTSGVPLVEQRIENLNIPDLLNGTPVTVSFYAGQPYGTLMPLTVGLYYATAVNNFGTQTLAVAATKNTPTLTTSNVYYTLDFTLTTSLGATNGLSLRFTTGAASAIGSTVLLTGVQVEKGLLATPFEVRPYVTELALCQRYYYQLTSPTAAVQGSAQVYAIFGTATGITTTAFWLPIQFPGPMRNPNYLLSNSAVTNFQLLPTGTTTITSVGLQTDSFTPVGATLNFVGTNIVAGSSYIFRTNGLTGSTTAFFGFSCEL